MAQQIAVRLNRVDAQPWGLRLQGGKDFGTPLVIQKVNLGSIADQAGLQAGDAVIKVNNVDVFNLRHKDAQDIIVRSGNSFEIAVQRGGATWRPAVAATGAIPAPSYSTSSPLSPVTKTSLHHQQEPSQHIGCGHNNAARPFPQNGQGPVKTIVNKQYNSPVGIYSEESIAETLSAQAEVLAGGVLGVNFKKNEKVYNSAGSEVLKALQEAENEPPEPEEPSYRAVTPVTKHVIAPVDRPAPPTTGGLPAGQNICADCERLIVGVFVRIKDKNLHVDCFKCATCGTSLKNQGYFNLNNKLYCDIHAKMAAIQSPPPGTEGYRPVPIQPNTKLSASTISAALSSHHGSIQNGTPHENVLASHSRNSSTASSVGSSYVSSTDSYKDSPSRSPPIRVVSNLDSLNVTQTAYRSSITVELERNKINGKENSSLLPKYQTKYAAIINNYSPEISNNDDIIDNEKLSENDNNNLDRIDGKNDDLLYATIRPHTKKKLDEPFNYKTLNGSVIRSVHPPGKGTNQAYKVNSSLSGPKPFSYAGPQAAGPKSPITYPPPPSNSASWTQSKPQQPSFGPPPKPAITNYNYGSNTLPRASGQSVPGRYNQHTQYKPQGNTVNYSSNYYNNVYSNYQGMNAQTNQKNASTSTASALKPGQYIPYAAPPLPSTLPPSTSLSENFKKETYEQGHATGLLEQSVQNIKVADRENFRINAGKIISTMLENRLQGKSLPPPKIMSDILNESKVAYPGNSYGHINLNSNIPIPPPMSDLSSGTGTKRNIAVLHVDNNLNGNKPLTPYQSSTPIGQPEISSKSLVSSETDYGDNVQSNVIMRNKNVYVELSTHALDRRSYIDKTESINDLVIDVNDPKSTHRLAESSSVSRISGNISSTSKDIVDELEDGNHPVCSCCNTKITRGPFITALGRIWCPDHFVCCTQNCRRPLQDIGFVEDKGQLYCEYCFEKYLAPPCDKCNAKIKGDCLNAIGKHYHPECFTCTYCGKLFGNSPFFLEEGQAYCETDWNELFTTKCFACGFPVEAGDRWVEALSHNYHSQCFNCTMCKKNLEGQSFFAKGGRPYCKNHAR